MTKESFYAEFKNVEKGNSLVFRCYEEYISWVGDPNTNLYDWFIIKFSKKEL